MVSFLDLGVLGLGFRERPRALKRRYGPKTPLVKRKSLKIYDLERFRRYKGLYILAM